MEKTHSFDSQKFRGRVSFQRFVHLFLSLPQIPPQNQSVLHPFQLCVDFLYFDFCIFAFRSLEMKIIDHFKPVQQNNFKMQHANFLRFFHSENWTSS